MEKNFKNIIDFDQLLKTLFDSSNFTQQPNIIVEIDCQDGTVLSHAFEFISLYTARGMKLNEFPLEVVALVLDESAFDKVRLKLSSIPHRIAKIADTKPQTQLDALKNLGIEALDATLCMSVFSKQVNVIDLGNQFGWIQFQTKSAVSLYDLASKGWFPLERSCYSYQDTMIMHLEKRSYIVRHPTLIDIPALMRIEKSCWPEKILTPERSIVERIQFNPKGQFVIEENGIILGVLYTQRIAKIELLLNSQADTLQKLYDPNGKIFQLISIFIDQQKQFYNLGDQFLEFGLQLASVTPGITHVAGVTRCTNYPGQSIISLEEYLKQTNNEDEILDPVPRMHVHHGAEIGEIVPNYRPNDDQNNGCGVLIIYDLETRNQKPAIKNIKKHKPDELSAYNIAIFVDELILGLLENCGGLVQQDNRFLYSRTSPLMDMGLDSLQLLELGSRLSEKYLIELEPTFFFQYGTADATISYLIEKKIEVFKDWLYEIQWRLTPLPESPPFTPDRLWILFDEDGELSQKLSQMLINNYQYCVTIKPGVAFKKINNEFYEINPNSSKDFIDLLKEMPRLSQLAGVIYLWGDQKNQSALTYTLIKEFLEKNCIGFVNLTNALALTQVPKGSKLWVVNQSMVSDGNDESLLLSPFNTLCKVVREEYPKSQCSHLALDPKVPLEENCMIICNELRSASNEPQIAWRKGTRLVSRMVRSQIEKFRSPLFIEDASYLVVGGFHPLGLQVARWYIEHGAKNIILLDEIQISPEIEAEVNSLKVTGANIATYISNFDDLPSLQMLFENIKNLKGLIHAAGVIEQDLLMHLTWDRFRYPNRLKIAGSWNLHQLTKNHPLDHFVLFSTCLTDLAPSSRASYLVANSFLDALSYYRRNLGLPSLTIDWGPWKGQKMLIQHMTDNTLASRVKLLNPDEGLLALESLFYISQPQITAAQVEWETFFRQSITENPLFSEIAAELTSKKQNKPQLQLNDPIAIIGMGCRFPDRADTPDKFWRIFKEGIDVITEVPSDRWDINVFYDPDKNAPGKMYTRFGGFINDVDQFDPQFFAISPHEAEDMDPQQRVSLEVAWEALENAGIPPTSLKGSNTGVFMGICFNDYGQLITQSGDIDAVDDYYSTGNHFSVSAGRISYILGLQGPAMAIDTACSSSLVAVDIACEKIHTGECDMAIAGGVNLILAPESTINFCKSGMLAEDGRCKTFDASANGYVRGEGCGIVILKRLSDAMRDNNPILAIIRATAVNQDGASTGLTVPNGQAQEKLIIQALKKANLEAKDIDYVEAHGTGTSLGDPIEVKSIVATYGQNRINPLIIGSAKTNIGHTEAAAGVAGLIKCILALQHFEIPKHLHFNKLNPYITLNENQVQISKEAMPWPSGKKKRYAAVSSFGFSGTNSHVIIEESPTESTTPIESPDSEYLLALSAKTQKSLRELIASYQQFLFKTEEHISDITYTANKGRSHFEHRIALSGKTKEEFISKLQNGDFTVSNEFQNIALKYCKGENIDWGDFYKNRHQKIVGLPNYPFQKQRCWSESATPRIGKNLASIHPLVGEMHSSPNGEIFFFGQLHLAALPYLKDHLVYEYYIYPAAGYLEMMLAAGVHVFDNIATQLTNVSVEAALSFHKGKPVDTQIIMKPSDAGYDASIYSLNDQKSWKPHVNAFAKVRENPQVHPKVDLEAIKARCKTILTKADFYKYVHSVGLCLGEKFHTLQNIYVSDGEGLGEVMLPSAEREYIAHPALLDGCLQLLFVLAWKAGSTSLFLPVGFDKVDLYAPLGDHVFAHWVQREVTDTGRSGDLTISNLSGEVLAVIEGIHFRKTNKNALSQMIVQKASIDDWLFEWKWEEIALEEIKTSDSMGQWLIFCDGKVSDTLIEKIENKGGHCRCIALKDLPKTKDGYITLLQKEPIEGILHVTSTVYPGILSADNISKGQSTGAESFLYLSQALLQIQDTIKIPTYLITQNVTTDNVIQSPLNGLIKTILAEHPEMLIKQIDLANEWEPNSFIQILFTKGSEAIYALRGSQCYVPRFIRLRTSESSQAKPNENNILATATYLITGGLGGLGLTLAKWLAENGAGHIVLAGRRELDEEKSNILKNLETSITKINYEDINVSDEKSVAILLDKLNKSEKPLKGIFNLAGTIDDATLLEQDWPHFERVFAAKVYGSFFLHKYSKDLDYFVMFSSIASSMGNPGQSNYAAANAFMDALCIYRKEKSMPALSISWSFWTDVGMAKNLVLKSEKIGMLGLNADDGIRAMEAALHTAKAHVTIANINWKNYNKQLIEAPMWYQNFIKKKETKEGLTAKLEAVPAGERISIVKTFVSDIVKGVLGLPASQQIDEKKGFFDMGLDSLMTIELKNRIQAGIGKSAAIATTAVFDHSSIDKMTNHLCKLLAVETIKTQKREKLIAPSQADEPIAIIGMACRFPGGANSLNEYWELLNEGRDAITEVPENRWDVDTYYNPDPDAPGKMTTKLGGFLDVDVSQFDAEFFGISPKEATYMDPQQRLLLEVSYEAIESAGIPVNALDGSLTAVFVGICTRDYMDLFTATGDKGIINAYMATGNMFSTACGRVSYTFGLQGPNFPIDTACSSSLVAIDHACEILRSGESNLALAGGVNLILAPDITINFSKAGMLAEDGHCKTFDAAADGYVRGEGCGVVVLKRLSDALREGDPIFAIIKASAINQDGASSGMTVPNGEAQVALIEHVLEKAKLKGADIDYLEAHGTGTKLGDPIEVRAIGETYGVRDPANPIKIGSVKTNIGHLEGAAGISGLIKTVLALQNETIPAHLNFHKLNPHIEINFPAEIATLKSPWKKGARIRRAAVSSFGFSGTNSHAIIEEAPKRESQKVDEVSLYILTLSAKSTSALDILVNRYLKFLSHTDSSIADICYTSNVGRTHQKFRLAAIAKDKKELCSKLNRSEFIKGEAIENVPFDFEPTADLPQLLDELAHAYTKGVAVDWKKLYLHQPRKKVVLPSYPFERRRYWAEDAIATSGKIVASVHPLLGEKHSNPNGDIFYLGELQLSSLPYLKDHRVYQYLIFPGAGHIEMMLAASVFGLDLSEVHLTNVNFEEPLSISSGNNAKIQVILNPVEVGYEIGIFSQKVGHVWQSHAHCNLLTEAAGHETRLDLEALKLQCNTTMSSEKFYQRINGLGMNLGVQFQTLNQIYLGENEACADLSISTSINRYLAHPALVDGAIQLLSVSPWHEKSMDLYLPVGCEHVRLYAPLEEHVFIHCQGLQYTDTSRSGNITISNSNGKVLLKLFGVHYRKSTPQLFKNILSHEKGISDFFYEEKLQELILPDAIVSKPAGNWLVLCDQRVSDELVGLLTNSGNTCTCIPIADHPKSKEAFIKLLNKEPYAGILHVSSTNDSEVISSDTIKSAQYLGTKSFLYLSQALIELQKTLKIPVFLITKNVASANLAHSPLLGLYKTVVAEYPELQIKLIDLGSNWDPLTLQKIIFMGGDENHLKVDKTQCYATRFVRMRETEGDQQINIKSDATYLITGGYGDLGLVLCKWLIGAGAENIVLIGRRKLDEVMKSVLNSMNTSNVKVSYESQNISDEISVSNLINRLQEGKTPLKGIFHLAGVLDDATLIEQDWTHFEKTFTTKVYGSFYLHKYSKGLDYFVMFSSIASSLGNPGQSNYAAANSFMDTLCEYRKQLGLAATSISWGPWAEVGMAKTHASRLAKGGLLGLKPEEGLLCLEKALIGNKSHLTIANINWKNYLKQMSHPPAFLEAFIERRAEKEDLLSKLKAANEKDYFEMIKTFVINSVISVLGATASQTIDDKKDFISLGFDSLMSIELKNKLQHGLGKVIEATAIYDHSSIDKMTEYLIHQLELENIQSKPEEVKTPRKIVKPIDLYYEADLGEETEIPEKKAKNLPEKLFFTGVTGGLGRHLLQKFAIQYENSELYCLVRAKNISEGFERIFEAMKKRKIDIEFFKDRIRPVLGDLSQPFMGISAKEYAELCKKIDLIIHCGAQTNWAYSYEMLKPTNVSGTLEIIKMAMKDVQKTIHHISTMAVLPFFKDDNYNTINEDIDILHQAPLILPYYQSKWVSEMQMHQARVKGLKINIYRPGSLVCDLQNGIPVTDEFSYRIIEGCRQLKNAPDIDFDISLSPLDVVGDIVAFIAANDKELNKNYNIVNPNKIKLKSFIDKLNEAGYSIKFVPFEKWIDLVKGLDSKGRNPVIPVLNILVDLLKCEETVKLTNNTEKAIANAKINFPTPSEKIVEVYIKGLLRQIQDSDR